MLHCILVVAVHLLLVVSPLAADTVILNAHDLAQTEDGYFTARQVTLPVPVTGQDLLGSGLPDEASRQLRMLVARGEAQGFAGFVYDNRDRGHSDVSPERFPQLIRLAYDQKLQEQNADYGLAGRILLPTVVLGNSSTAIAGGPLARSLPRLAMTIDDGPAATARLYDRNALYLYPEHRDHDAADRFPANWPYMVISQGSSRSDQPFLEALLLTLAAFTPETFTTLEANGLVAPTLQAILRRNLAPVNRRSDYFTGAAHPVAFDRALLRPGRMVAHAAGMQADAIPPRIEITVIEETFRDAAGLAGLSERLFDTPQAVGRIWRSFDGAQEIVVSAETSRDPNGRALAFTWSILQGDPDLIELEPLGDAGERARIRLRWHDPWEAAVRFGEDASRRALSRVDIGVFADNGAEISAPAILSISFPAHQTRTYAEADLGPRLVSIDYDARGRDAAYDPLLHWSAPWLDTAIRNADGTLIGWERRQDGKSRRVPPHGTSYQIDRRNPARPILVDTSP